MVRTAIVSGSGLLCRVLGYHPKTREIGVVCHFHDRDPERSRRCAAQTVAYYPGGWVEELVVRKGSAADRWGPLE